MQKINSHKDLKVWEESINLAEMIYKATVNFPAEEKYGLKSQIRRAAVSIPANISEGAGRQSPRELMHFVSIARGSAAELETHLVLAKRLGFPLIESDSLFEKLDHIGRMLTNLYKSLKS